MTLQEELTESRLRQTITIRGTTLEIIQDDVFSGLKEHADYSFDLAIIDPPYGASTDAKWQLPAGHGLSGFGGRWDIASHAWDKLTGLESFEMTLAYLTEMKRLVKPTGSFFVHSTYHNSGIVNVAAQMLGIEILNEIIWFKRNAFPNLANRRLTASHETIFWLHTGTPSKRQYRYNAEAVKQATFHGDSIKNAGKQMRTVWDIGNNKHRSELAYGKHPTQKPLRVSERLLLMAGTPGGNMLAPFAGSGTELVAASRYDMSSIGYEIDPEYFQLTVRRAQAEAAQPLQQTIDEA